MTAKGSSEKRLQFLRNIEAAETDPKRSGKAYEFEVLADVPAHGLMQVGPIAIRPWDLAGSVVGDRHSLIFAMLNLLGPEVGNQGRGPPEEVCAFASVVLRRRISLGPLLRLDDRPMRIPSINAKQSPQLLAGKIDLGDLRSAIERIRSMPDDLHEPFLLACRFYQEALDLLDGKPDVAYLLLVSVIEIFVARLKLRQTEADLSPHITAALARLEPAERVTIVQRLLEVDRGIQKNFVRFVLSHVRQSFWEASPHKLSPAEGRIEQTELEHLLNRIYDQRSRMVHAGEPLPPNIENPPESFAEIDRSMEVTALGRKWRQSEFLPYVRFFERLVQHVLMTFLERQAEGAGPHPARPS
jgi:hypothetical protein